MKLNHHHRPDASPAFTILEVLIASSLLLALVLAGMNALFVMDNSSRRLADMTAAMAVVQGQLERVRTNDYNPPLAPFIASATVTNTAASISLDKGGTNYLVAGTLTTRIEPVASGHLVTVSATFNRGGNPLRAQLQTVVNKFSGGQP
jgi:type II secretory pathway pseudopilin PulG